MQSLHLDDGSRGTECREGDPGGGTGGGRGGMGGHRTEVPLMAGWTQSLCSGSPTEPLWIQPFILCFLRMYMSLHG